MSLPAQNNKIALLEEVVQTATDYEGLASIVGILRREERVFRFVPSLCPLREKYRISDYFGYRIHPVSGKRQFHAGIDLAAAYASTVHATADGVIVSAGSRSGYGRTVIIRHRYGFMTQYSHLTYIYCRVGQQVVKGDIIGFVGNTGTSTGDHLHYEIIKNNKKVNPLKFISLWNLEMN